MGPTAPPVHRPESRRASGGRPQGVLLAVLAAVAALVVVTAAAIAGVVARQGGTAAPSHSTPATPNPAASASMPTSGPSPSSPAVAPPTAVLALSAFLSAAARLDGQLATAAATINSAGPPWKAVSAATARSVTAADLRPVAHAIPAGLPPELLRQVVLVYSDLASRRYAMGSFSTAFVPVAGGYPSQADLLAELRNGAPAAARFAADLLSLRTAAAATAPVAAVAHTSRRYAEVLLLVDYVNRANGGCDSRGGAVITTLPVIRWHASGALAGTIGRLGFVARLVDGRWTAYVNAC